MHRIVFDDDSSIVAICVKKIWNQSLLFCFSRRAQPTNQSINPFEPSSLLLTIDDGEGVVPSTVPEEIHGIKGDLGSNALAQLVGIEHRVGKVHASIEARLATLVAQFRHGSGHQGEVLRGSHARFGLARAQEKGGFASTGIVGGNGDGNRRAGNKGAKERSVQTARGELHPLVGKVLGGLADARRSRDVLAVGHDSNPAFKVDALDGSHAPVGTTVRLEILVRHLLLDPRGRSHEIVCHFCLSGNKNRVVFRGGVAKDVVQKLFEGRPVRKHATNDRKHYLELVVVKFDLGLLHFVGGGLPEAVGHQPGFVVVPSSGPGRSRKHAPVEIFVGEHRSLRRRTNMGCHVLLSCEISTTVVLQHGLPPKLFLCDPSVSRIAVVEARENRFHGVSGGIGVATAVRRARGVVVPKVAVHVVAVASAVFGQLSGNDGAHDLGFVAIVGGKGLQGIDVWLAGILVEGIVDVGVESVRHVLELKQPEDGGQAVEGLGLPIVDDGSPGMDHAQ
mmetsp:Transcript_15527/g.31905  ORF Transcript_15527/g.31905 Transcript_15527/m.31905 type:complete len:505 (-) Transcript_15527:398-1912(-)